MDEDCPVLVDPEDSLRTNVVEAPKRIPVTIITGFLGAGKSTLINHILTEEHNRKIAVIINDFGDDKSGSLETPAAIGSGGQVYDEWMELRNGCLCCSVKDASVKAIEKLMEKRGKFDYVLLETSGLADPAPIASMFWLDESLESELVLDGIVAVVDAKRCLGQLADAPHSTDTGASGTPSTCNEAVRQIALADRIVLNKTDLLSGGAEPSASLQAVRDAIHAINASAAVQLSVKSKVPVDFVLNLGEFDASSRAARFLEEQGELMRNSHSNSAKDALSGRASKYSSVSTVALNLPLGVFSRDALDKWLQCLLWERQLEELFPEQSRKHTAAEHCCSDDSHSHAHSHGGGEKEQEGERSSPMSVLRLKGIVYLQGHPNQLTVQGVCETFDIQDGAPWASDPSQAKETRLVVVGQYLNAGLLEYSFRRMCCS